MTEEPPRRYSDADVNRIIKRALKIDSAESISHAELLETAAELGIDPDKIEAAIKIESAAIEKERMRADFRKRARARFKAGLMGFIGLNSLLFFIDFMTPGGWWFQWPLLGTGIALVGKLKYAYFLTDEQMERVMRNRKHMKKRYYRRHHCAIW